MPHHLIDIGANLTDTMYQGVYGGRTYHQPDLDQVLQRAWAAGVQRIIITAGNLEDAHRALELAQTDGAAQTAPNTRPPCTQTGCFAPWAATQHAVVSLRHMREALRRTWQHSATWHCKGWPLVNAWRLASSALTMTGVLTMR